MRKNWLLPLLLSLSFFVFIVVKSDRGVRVDLQSRGDSFIEGLKIVHKRKGVSDWVLTAKKADITKGGDEAVLHDLVLAMKERGFTIHADRGIYNLEDKNVEIIGKITADGRLFSITTENVSFDNDSGVLKTDAPVRIEGKKYVLQGTGLKADTEEQKMRISQNVQATFYR